MTYPFVQAATDYGRAKGPRLAVTWHMAEGGGTVGYLSRPNPNGVSVHFVVEREGRIVQMLREDHANGSIRPSAIRTTDDPPYGLGVPVTYGATAAKDVLGDWWRDPNSATLGVEVEGYAADGPNAAQRDAMAALWTDLRSRYPSLRSLAHRDFADYKACPGRLIPWDRLGGHGPASEDDTMILLGDRDLASRRVCQVPAGTQILRDTAGSVLVTTTRDLVMEDCGYPSDGSPYRWVRVQSARFDDDPEVEDGLALVRLSDVTLRVKTAAELRATAERFAAPDCAAAVSDAITDDRAKARITWEG